MVSVWLPESDEAHRLSDMGDGGGRGRPQRALTKMGELSGTTGTPN